MPGHCFCRGFCPGFVPACRGLAAASVALAQADFARAERMHGQSFARAKGTPWRRKPAMSFQPLPTLTRGVQGGQPLTRGRPPSRPSRYGLASTVPMTEPLTLSPAGVEQIARRVVAILHEGSLAEPRYVDAATLAEELSVERDWVYSHAEELGGFRLGGPKGRLRFDRAEVARRLRAPQRAKVGSSQIQRRAGVGAPARSPKQHQNGR